MIRLTIVTATRKYRFDGQMIIFLAKSPSCIASSLWRFTYVFRRLPLVLIFCSLLEALFLRCCLCKCRDVITYINNYVSRELPVESKRLHIIAGQLNTLPTYSYMRIWRFRIVQKTSGIMHRVSNSNFSSTENFLVQQIGWFCFFLRAWSKLNCQNILIRTTDTRRKHATTTKGFF